MKTYMPLAGNVLLCVTIAEWVNMCVVIIQLDAFSFISPAWVFQIAYVDVLLEYFKASAILNAFG